MRCRFLVSIGLVGLLVLAGSHIASPPARGAAEGQAPADVVAKPVMIMTRDSVAVTLERAEVHQLGGRAFLVGAEMKNPPVKLTKEQFGGRIVWVPVDAITQMVELEAPREK